MTVARTPYRSALIVGAGPGLGGSLARVFSRDGGLQVLMAARQPERLQAVCTEVGSRALRCDATDPDDVAALFDEATRHFGAAPDVVVYNASRRVPGRFVDIDAQARLINSEGWLLAGTADALRPASLEAAAPLPPIRVMHPPAATRKVVVELNLDARHRITFTGRWGASFDAIDAQTYNAATAVNVHDIKGQEVSLTLFFQKAANATLVCTHSVATLLGQQPTCYTRNQHYLSAACSASLLNHRRLYFLQLCQRGTYSN